MTFIEIIILSISLAMDAFSVSICKGLNTQNNYLKKVLITGIYFGTFQSIMTILGSILGSTCSKFINTIDYLIAFVFLIIIGINMLISNSKEVDESFNFLSMIIASIATSIDALVIGITLSFMKTNIYLASLCIGIITFILSALGIVIGHIIGNKYHKIAEKTGGIFLIFLALKILLEHL